MINVGTNLFNLEHLERNTLYNNVRNCQLKRKKTVGIILTY